MFLLSESASLIGADTITVTCILSFLAIFWLSTYRRYKRLFENYFYVFMLMSIFMSIIPLRRCILFLEGWGVLGTAWGIGITWLMAGFCALLVGLFIPFARGVSSLDLAETTRRASEEKFLSIFTLAPDAIIISDAESTIQDWNQSAERIFGWTKAEILGKSLLTIMPQRYHAMHLQGMKLYLNTGGSKIIGKTIPIAAINKSGAEFPIELSIGTYELDEKKYFMAIVRDKTVDTLIQPS